MALDWWVYVLFLTAGMDWKGSEADKVALPATLITSYLSGIRRVYTPVCNVPPLALIKLCNRKKIKNKNWSLQFIFSSTITALNKSLSEGVLTEIVCLRGRLLFLHTSDTQLTFCGKGRWSTKGKKTSNTDRGTFTEEIAILYSQIVLANTKKAGGTTVHDSQHQSSAIPAVKVFFLPWYSLVNRHTP